MTSLFESAEPIGGPVDLMPRGGQGVALLEFMALGSEVEDDAAAVVEDTLGSVSEEQKRAIQMSTMLDAARQEAASEARRELAEEFEFRVKRERRRVEGLLVEFGEQRRRYFTQAEAAVIRLALSVAAKILQREVTADAMFLVATVRAALSHIQDGSTAVLRVRPEEVGIWEQVLTEEGANRVEVKGDKTMSLGDCVLQTTIGRVELGVVAQLGEIERGFQELLRRSGT